MTTPPLFTTFAPTGRRPPGPTGGTGAEHRW